MRIGSHPSPFGGVASRPSPFVGEALSSPVFGALPWAFVPCVCVFVFFLGLVLSPFVSYVCVFIS